LVIHRNRLAGRLLPRHQTRVQNRFRAVPLQVLLIVSLGLGGCATATESAKKEAPDNAVAATEAPLGSRIKRKTTVNPINSSNREMIEQQRVQQGAIATGMVNNPSKYSGPR
jgi:hypothetical protein